MTVSTDARTPSASVHALSGSTPPGTDTTMQPFGVAAKPAGVAELPDTFMPLGAAASSVVAGLTARRAALAQADAEVIDLATRVTSLAERESRIWGRRSELEDAVFRALPPEPTRPEMRGGVTSVDTIVDGARTVAVTTPAGWDEERRANEAAYEAAVAERDGQEAEIAARLGLPRLEKMADRVSHRLNRWGLRLAETAPQTQAGLRAKAAASTVMNERGSSLDPCWQALAHSVSADALRLISAEVDAIEAACADPFSAYHLEIVSIQEALKRVDGEGGRRSAHEALGRDRPGGSGAPSDDAVGRPGRLGVCAARAPPVQDRSHRGSWRRGRRERCPRPPSPRWRDRRDAPLVRHGRARERSSPGAGANRCCSVRPTRCRMIPKR